MKNDRWLEDLENKSGAIDHKKAPETRMLIYLSQRGTSRIKVKPKGKSLRMVVGYNSQ